jgi:thiol:disulfide interchange protein DsbG
MRKIILSILITAVVCLGCSAAAFWWYTAPKLEQATTLINTVTRGGVNILNQFQASNNLEGYVVQSTQNNAQSIVYVDNQGRYLFFGNLFGETGQNLSAQDFQTYIAPQSASIAFNYLNSVAYIQQGSNKALHQIYVVFDPNCIYCHRLFDLLQPYIAKGSLAVRWVPVAFLRPTSQGRVYAMLSSSNPQAVLTANETNFNESTEEGGAPILSTPSTQVKQQLVNNMAFLTAAQITVTPVLFYKSTKGLAGMITGLPDATKLSTLIQGFGTAF